MRFVICGACHAMRARVIRDAVALLVIDEMVTSWSRASVDATCEAQRNESLL